MIRPYFAAPAVLVALLATIAGCTGSRDDGYPSLLPRPIEKRGFADLVAKPPPVAEPDAALDREVARTRAGLAQAGSGFNAQADTAERLAARAGNAAPGSETWIAAQVALAELDTLRGGTAGALADIERLGIDRATEGKPPYPALQALLAEARIQNAREAERIARIGGMMRPSG